MICSKLEKCIREKIEEKNITCCDNAPAKCIESADKRSNVKCEERGRKYILQNTRCNYVISYRVDGGVIVLDKTVPVGTCKCDYMFVIGKENTDAVLIELKGVDVRHALKQIQGVINQYRDVLQKFEHIYARIIVTSSTPNLKASPEYVQLARLIQKELKGNIKIFSKQLSEKDTELNVE